MNLGQHLGRNTPCYAPISSLYFDILGRVTVCCLNREYPVGVYPKNNIHDIWFGSKLSILRKEMAANVFNAKGCQSCIKHIVSSGKENTILSTYDFAEKYLPSKYPVVLTFETSNACNYECIMCGGMWSSSIRANREKLSPLNTVYSESFVEELREFIPYAKRINFLGGEPFLSSINFKILDLIAELNPSASVIITSNGSIMNDRIKDLFNKLPNLVINLSIDSLDKKTYELIRLRSNFANVKTNIDYLLSIGRLHGLSVCPIIQNIYELPDIIEFCNNHRILLCLNNVNGPLDGYIEGIHEKNDNNIVHFNANINTIKVPIELQQKIPEVCLKTLPLDEKYKIKEFLSAKNFGIYNKNINNLIDFIFN